jgi:molybdopterin/thiamine biosynthesis adenylyltransferase
MNDNQLLRYSRHILLDELGIEGQQRLLGAHALVIGAGGLGSPVALYLGTAGVGRITLVDNDTVDLTNLQRQIAHDMSRIGQAKVDSAAQSVNEINPEVTVVALQERADAQRLDALVATADVVVDGQISVYDTRQAEAPCYACIFPPDVAFEEVRCATMGVLAPLVGIIGSMQAAEALKLLAGTGSSLAGRLQMLDARSMEWTEIRTPRNADCSVCGTRNS